MKLQSWSALLVVLGTLVHASASAFLTLRAFRSERSVVTGGAKADLDLLPTPGSTLKGVDATVFRRADRTIAVAFSSHCPICRRNVPFYRTLSRRMSSIPGRQVVFLVPDSPDEVSALLTAGGVVGREIITIDFASAGMVATPVLMLCDRDGRLLQRWVGLVDQDAERAVLAGLGAD